MNVVDYTLIHEAFTLKMRTDGRTDSNTGPAGPIKHAVLRRIYSS